ncbi:Translation initiation factor eIF4, subunit E, type 2, partial [Chondrus crispus]
MRSASTPMRQPIHLPPPPLSRGVPENVSALAAKNAPPSVPAGHLLHRTYHFSYVRRTFEKKAENYGAQIKRIAAVATVEEFWGVYTHLQRVSKLPPMTDYYLFQEGVQPMWEDDANKRGGRLLLRVQKHASPRAFEDLCLAVIGEQFDTDDICGIACSVRFQENYLSIWVRDAKNKPAIAAVENKARGILKLPAACV